MIPDGCSPWGHVSRAVCIGLSVCRDEKFMDSSSIAKGVKHSIPYQIVETVRSYGRCSIESEAYRAQFNVACYIGVVSCAPILIS
jgi:hypothetical protein